MAGDLKAALQTHTCLYASFDDTAHADVSRGSDVPTMHPDVVDPDPNAGVFGGALVFSARDHAWAEDEFTYLAKDNFPYRMSAFDGTIAFWLCGDPDADLHPEFPVDPFHISRQAADASFYLDLTKPNDWRYGSPRKLRFGFYNDSPENDMFVGGQLIVVGDLGFGDGEWHHVAATFRNCNSGAADGEAAVYVDGKLRGTMAGYEHRLSWDVDKLKIGLGQRYVGAIDELLILDTALDAEQVAEVVARDQPLSTLYDAD